MSCRAMIKFTSGRFWKIFKFSNFQIFNIPIAYGTEGEILIQQK